MALFPVRLPGATRSILAEPNQRWVGVAPEIVEALADWSEPVRFRVQSGDAETRVVELVFQAQDRTVVAEGRVSRASAVDRHVFTAGDYSAKLPPDAPVAEGRYRLVLERLPDPRPDGLSALREAGRGPEDG